MQRRRIGASAASGRARTTRSAVAGSRCSSSRDDGPQPPGHAVADHRVADGLADHETARACTRTASPKRRRAFGEVVEHHGRPPGAPPGPDDRGELRTPAQACLRGQHLRRRASRDPCADGRRGSPGPRGCASAAGSRGSWTDGGCSAGTCACSRGTPTTRHRRCAPAGGRARGGLRCARLEAATPVPRKLVPADRHAHRAPRAEQGERAEPATDSDQHSRGRGGCRRSAGSRPLMVHPRPAGPGRRAAIGHAATRPATRARSPGAIQPDRGIVAGLWMRLLASPSLRVGRQGHGAWADPVGQPTAELARSPARNGL